MLNRAIVHAWRLVRNAPLFFKYRDATMISEVGFPRELDYRGKSTPETRACGERGSRMRNVEGRYGSGSYGNWRDAPTILFF